MSCKVDRRVRPSCEVGPNGQRPAHGSLISPWLRFLSMSRMRDMPLRDCTRKSIASTLAAHLFGIALKLADAVRFDPVTQDLRPPAAKLGAHLGRGVVQC